MKLVDEILNLVFPPKCPLCEKIMDKPGICEKCFQSAPWLEKDDAIRRLANDIPCAAPLRYKGPVRDALLRLKFQGGASVAGPLGDALGRCVQEIYGNAFDLTTWTPVSKKRLRKRGYDQARLLAESACRRWNAKPVPLLRKIRNNPAQSSLKDADARAVNVQNVYQPQGDFQGKRVLLIDDICTTGSTLSACAGTLLEAGAAQILCATVALTDFEAENQREYGKE